MDENSPEGRRKLHHAVLELVYGLSSDVSVKKNSTGLHMWVFKCMIVWSLANMDGTGVACGIPKARGEWNPLNPIDISDDFMSLQWECG